MTTPWTEAQVSALTDANALRAARGLAARWREAGHRETALWGRCAGSGAEPYATVVDLSGPAFRCSCPSRKVPCKHALSLLLRWSAGAVPEAGEVPDYAAEWLARRAARTAPVEKTARTSNPATAAQRQVRVTAGLEELDVWLGDQVRTGLAQADRTYRAYESIAARMVDAQAPAVATALRQIPTVIATRADWPDLVLNEYARLHLLIRAHRRMDELPGPLGASVRTHIGYPTSAESVRAEPPVRDHWMAMATRHTEEDRLHTRRTWLRGRATHRWALLLDHNFGSPEFSTPALIPGTMVDTDLHFYPAAAPLRAVRGEQHGHVEPFTTIPSPVDPAVPTRSIGAARPGDPPDAASGASSPVGTALDAYARALGDDPWLRSWPVLLRDVVPVAGENGWLVVDSEGAALPVSEAGQPWQLLGISGGYPVTLTAEWTAAGLVPLSVLLAGEVIDVVGERAVARTAQAAAPSGGGSDLTSTALLGTARRAPDPARLPSPVAAVATELRTDPPLALLESAALRSAFARGGVKAGTVGELPAPAVHDPRRLLPVLAGRRLTSLLGDNSPFLPEWFDTAEPYDYRVPDALCALLLEHAAASTRWRPRLLRLAGERGRWLAAANPLWRPLIPATPAFRSNTSSTNRVADASVSADRAGSGSREGGTGSRVGARANRDRLTDSDADETGARPGRTADTDAAVTAPGHGHPGDGVASAAGSAADGHQTAEGPTDAEGGERPGSEVWRFGGAQARKDWLTSLRQRDPRAARDMLVAVWAKESGALRAQLLATLEAGISVEDESFLDAALDDRRADVRRAAAGLLALLPDSAFAHRMTERAAAWLRPVRLRDDGAGARTHLVIDIPEPVDDPARRDGIVDRGGEFSYRWGGGPDSAAAILRHLVAATPLRHWESGLGAPTRFSPEELTGVGVEDRFRQPLFDGWVDAALAQRDPRWARALFETGVPSDTALLRRRELFALLPPADRTRHLLRLDGSWLSEIEALLPALDHPWPDQVSHHLLLLFFERARIAAQPSGAHGARPGAHRSLLTAAATHLPVTAAATVSALARRCDDPTWQHAFDRLAHDLTYRSMMLEELQ